MQFLPGEQERSDDPAAADYFVVVVEDSGLAGGDGALGFVEGGQDFAGFGRLEGGPGGVVAVADFDLDAQGGGERGNADPVEAAGAEGARGELFVGAHGDAVGGGVNVEHVERRGRADAEALALAYGEVGDAVVMAEEVAV